MFGYRAFFLLFARPAYLLIYSHGVPLSSIHPQIAFAVVSALQYLHAELKVIHRDVKPSNILINRRGEVKMCDFGISGYLVDSVAKTIDAGCKPYMAPERIDPSGELDFCVCFLTFEAKVTVIDY